MSVIWSGVTEEGAVVPVQVTDEGKVVAVGDGPQGDYLPITGGTLTGDLKVADGISLKTDGSSTFTGGITATGTSTFENSIKVGTNINIQDGILSVKRNAALSNSAIEIRDDSTMYGYVAIKAQAFLHSVKIGAPGSWDATSLNTDGSANFKGGVVADTRTAGNGIVFYGINNSTALADATLQLLNGGATGGGAIGYLISGLGPNAVPVFNVRNDGSAQFSSRVWIGQGDETNSSGLLVGKGGAAQITYDGAAVFSGDVVIGSRGEKWLIRESNGVAMLVMQSREAAPMIPEKVRDIPSELDLIEMALNEVMEKLRMTPPAGWPVWDGSDNP